MRETFFRRTRKFVPWEANLLLGTIVGPVDVKPEKVETMQRMMNNLGTTYKQQSHEVHKQTRIVLGLGHTLFAANLADQLRMEGHDVRMTAVPEMGRRLAVRIRAQVLVLPYLAHDPLLTAKIANAVPSGIRTILVSDRPEAERFAELMGLEFAFKVGDHLPFGELIGS